MTHVNPSHARRKQRREAERTAAKNRQPLTLRLYAHPQASGLDPAPGSTTTNSRSRQEKA